MNHPRSAPRNNRAGANERGAGGNLLLGIFLGFVGALVLAGGLAWFFLSQPSEFKTPERAPEVVPLSIPQPITRSVEPAYVEPPAPPAPVLRQPEPPPPPAPAPVKAKPAPAPAPAPVQRAAPAPAAPAMPAKAAAPAAPTFEFHAILEGGKTAKPAAAVKPQEVWWLQVAALRQAADAEQLRSRLALANMEATVVPVQSGDNTLYRVRVGPFKTEAAAKTVADLLLKNNLEPRLLKEPVQP